MTLACVMLALLCVTERASARSPGPRPAIRLDRDSFWYDRADGNAADPNDVGLTDSAERLAEALAVVLVRHANRFPQPPPIATVIRAVSREELQTHVLWSASMGSYGCARLVDAVVVIEVAPSTFIGRDSLNDAELRSFLGHELVHAYQYARGDHAQEPDEIARREVQALQWEIDTAEPGVRDAYREDLRFNLKMYRAILGN